MTNITLFVTYNFIQFYRINQSESTHFNIEAVVTTYKDPSIAQLEVRSAPGLAGKKIALFNTKFFVDGLPVCLK